MCIVNSNRCGNTQVSNAKCRLFYIKGVQLNPIPAGGRSLGLPLTFFGDNSKSIGLRLFKFFDFLLWAAQSKVFCAYCLSPHANYLNALFWLYLTKSIFRPIFGHWIYSFLESLEWKEADCTIFEKNFASIFALMSFLRFSTFSVFLE